MIENNIGFFWLFLAIMIVFFGTGGKRPDLQDALIYKLTGEKIWEKMK